MVDKNVVRRGYDGLAETYAEEREPEDREGDLLERLLDDLPRPAQLLDVGCGQGEPVLRRLNGEPDLETFGIDLSSEQLRFASDAAPDVSLARGDMTDLQVESDVADAVTAFHSVIHVPMSDHQAVIDEFARVLRSGGYILLTEGTNDWQGTNLDWLESGVEMQWHIAGADETRAQLRDAGFEIREEWLVGDELADGESYWTVFLARLEA